MNLIFSVIIPTFNRAEILARTLISLKEQTLSKEDFEVIVIDDGSSDNTKEIIADFITQNTDLHLSCFYKKNEGQGIARNFGINKSKGNIIVFIGDDIILDRNFLAEHLKFHQEHKSANNGVLGLIKWHPDLTISPFMNWLTNGSSIFGKFGGHQFAYEKLEGKLHADFNFFYTSNISLKRELIEKKEDQFDEEFGSYGWEDIELGYRLYKKYGLKILYNESAIGYHYHQLNESSLEKRMFMIGKSAHIIDSKHPELKKVPSGLKKFCLKILGSLPVLFCVWIVNQLTKQRYRHFWYYALSKRYFISGIDTK